MEHDIRERDSRTAARERVVHVPRVAEEDDALLGMASALLDRREERIGHAPETVLRERGVDRRVQRHRQLWDDVVVLP